MSEQTRKAYIEELVTEFCLADSGDCQARASLFWATYPELKQEYIEASGKMAAQFLPARINKNLRDAAFNEDENETNVEQLMLPGIPFARLSPLVEVAPGDWRREIDVSMNQQIIHSDRMKEKARRKALYQEHKGREQRVAADAMERRVPGSAAMPRGQVIEHWREIGLFDDEPVQTHQATT